MPSSRSGADPAGPLAKVCDLPKGFTGHVELVTDPQAKNPRVLARKRLQERYRADPVFRAAFLADAKAAQALQHPNVVHSLEVGEDEDGPYLTMEHVDGIPVVDLLSWAEARNRGLPKPVAIRIARDVASALHELHELRSADGTPLGLLHRNVSSRNILVGHEGAVLLTDVAAGRALGGDEAGKPKVIRGNRGYLAPEQLRLEKPTRQTDIFALGVVLWEMLAGERLYPNREGSDGPRGILHEAPPNMTEIRRSVSVPLAALIDEMLARDPQARPASARDVAHRLDTLLATATNKNGDVEIAPFMARHFHAVRREQKAELTGQLERLGIAAERTPLPPLRAEADGSSETRWQKQREAVRKPPSPTQVWLLRIALTAAAALIVTTALYGSRSRDQPTPPPSRQVPNPGQTLTAWAGAWHACASEDRTLYCWGRNAEGQLGVGSTGDAWSRRPVRTVTSPAAVSLGLFHTCACDESGQAYCWGRNKEGQLGLGLLSAEGMPAPRALVGETDCVHIAAGGFHTCAVRRGGTVACWGSNEQGQIGQPASPPVARPTPVVSLSNALAVAAHGDEKGESFSCALLGNGGVSCWGSNLHGQLGDGSRTAHARPAPVLGLTDAVELSAGNGFACARRQAGTVACWGNNATAVMGPSARAVALTPVTIDGVRDVVQIAAGGGHVCALSRSGALSCWGSNARGQLGNGTQVDSGTPVRVVDVDRFLFVAAGQTHTCGRHATGLVCWGESSQGQLGTGLDTLRARPASAAGFQY